MSVPGSTQTSLLLERRGEASNLGALCTVLAQVSRTRMATGRGAELGRGACGLWSWAGALATALPILSPPSLSVSPFLQ